MHLPEARRASLVTLALAIATIVGMSIDVLFWRLRFHQTPIWHFFSIGVSLVTIGVVSRYPRTRKQWLASAAFVLNNAFTEVAVWRASTLLALGEAQWAPYQAEKLGAIAVAVLAPPNPLAGLLSIAIFVGGAVVHHQTFEPTVRAHFLAEPWTTVAYGAVALLLYVYRLHALRIERTMAESLAAKRAIEQVSRMLLAVRDFSNTPIQTLYLTTALLRARHHDDSELLERMDRSLARLRELNEIMSRYESKIGWESGDESLDAAATLQRGFTSTRASSSEISSPRIGHP
jgi:hypothetical protein